MSSWYERRMAELQPPHHTGRRFGGFNPWAVPPYGQFLADVFAEFWWKGRQLTTGSDVTPRVCLCRTIVQDDGTSGFHTVQWTNPACSLHGDPPRPRPVATYGRPPACTCRYGLHPTIWNPTHLIDVKGVGQRGAAYTFRIDPRCPHHGDVRRAESVIDWCEQNGFHLFAWQRDAIRAAYTGQMVQRSRRNGMTTVLRALEAYGERVPIVLDEAGAWLVLDDAERRGD